MNNLETNVIRGLLLTVLIGLLMACGGGGGGSASTSVPVVAKGVITELGSIWVNGVEYETPDGGLYSSDDESVKTTALEAEALYKVGQVVGLRGTRNPDGISGTANEVEYEAEVEGAASGGAINNVTILIDESQTNVIAEVDGNGALINGNRYEVSGFWVGDSTIQATFIKDDDDIVSGIDEVKGEVDAVDLTSITVNGVKYLYSDAAALATFSEGDFVEVHFNPNTCTGLIPSRTCDADIVEPEDDFNDGIEGLEAEFEGPVNLTDAASCPTPATSFMIGTTCIDWSSVPSDGWQDGLTDENDLVSGLRVEAEGHFNAADVLIAEKIKGRGNQVRITAIATSIDGTAGTLVVFAGVAVPIDVTFESGLTEIENGALNSISSADNGLGFEIRGIRTDTTGAPSVLALRIKDKNVGPNDHELRAEVDVGGVDSSSPNIITVMGITSIVDPDTKLVDEDAIIAEGGGTLESVIDNFLDSIDDDGIVNITNGPNDVVDVQIVDITVGAGSLGSPYTAKEVEIEREDD